ncbi:unnamed protein product [Arctogadus glacialis]
MWSGKLSTPRRPDRKSRAFQSLPGECLAPIRPRTKNVVFLGTGAGPGGGDWEGRSQEGPLWESHEEQCGAVKRPKYIYNDGYFPNVYIGSLSPGHFAGPLRGAGVGLGGKLAELRCCFASDYHFFSSRDTFDTVYPGNMAVVAGPRSKAIC